MCVLLSLLPPPQRRKICHCADYRNCLCRRPREPTVNIKLDENMPEALVPVLAELGHDADTVPQEGRAGQEDTSVWDAAQQAKRFLITQDLDFSDSRKFVPGTHYGLLLIRLRDPGRTALRHIVETLFETEPVETWHGCLVVATERKLRVLRPPDQEE